MAFEIVTVPCLADNYAFLLINNGGAVLIDVPEAEPILKITRERNIWVHSIWLTHHHDDHVQGVGDFLDGHPDGHDVRIFAAKRDAHRIPNCDYYFEDGEIYAFTADHKVHVMDVSGHTVGHIALYVPDAKAVFTADSLMALGCGRLFEGTPEQMWESLSKLAALPPETLVCSGHEYTASNLAFAMTIEPDNTNLLERAQRIAVARDRGKPTVPSTLSEELATNPFLRAGLEEVKKELNMIGEADWAVFAEIRRRKDSF